MIKRCDFPVIVTVQRVSPPEDDQMTAFVFCRPIFHYITTLSRKNKKSPAYCTRLSEHLLKEYSHQAENSIKSRCKPPHDSYTTGKGCKAAKTFF